MSKGRKKPAASASLPPLPPEMAALLSQLLAALQQALAAGKPLAELVELLAQRPADPAVDHHLLAALARWAHPAIPELLAALFAGETDRGRQKALKKALHLLKSRGVPVAEDLLPREERPRAAGPALTMSAQASPVFGNGERYLILEGERRALGATILVVRLSDLAGLQEVHSFLANRGQREELWQHLRQQGLEDWVAVPPAYAVRLLEEAFALNPQASGAKDYALLRNRLWQHAGQAAAALDPEREAPPCSGPELAAALERSRELGRLPYFHSWLPGPEEVAPWLRKIMEAESSPLILTEHQQKARLEDLLLEAVRHLYPPEGRDLWRRRLLHMAYFLELKGLAGEAGAARAAAQDLATRAHSPLLGENPFLVGLVHLALRLAREYQQAAAAPPSGFIAPPGASPLLVRR